MNYEFLNTITNEIEEHTMCLADYEQFKIDNPHLQRHFSTSPSFGDGMRMNVPGVGKPDAAFEKYVINRIKETVPGNTVKDGHKTKMPREW